MTQKTLNGLWTKCETLIGRLRYRDMRFDEEAANTIALMFIYLQNLQNSNDRLTARLDSCKQRLQAINRLAEERSCDYDELTEEHKREVILKKVENALGFTLYDWQKKYINGESDYMPDERCSGRTTACALKLCLSEGPQLDLSRRCHHILLPYAGEDCSTHAGLDFFRHWLYITYSKLEAGGGIPLREIKFKEAKE